MRIWEITVRTGNGKAERHRVRTGQLHTALNRVASGMEETYTAAARQGQRVNFTVTGCWNVPRPKAK